MYFFSFENDKIEWMMITVFKEKKTIKEINKIGNFNKIEFKNK